MRHPDQPEQACAEHQPEAMAQCPILPPRQNTPEGRPERRRSSAVENHRVDEPGERLTVHAAVQQTKPVEYKVKWLAGQKRPAGILRHW